MALVAFAHKAKTDGEEAKRDVPPEPTPARQAAAATIKAALDARTGSTLLVHGVT